MAIATPCQTPESIYTTEIAGDTVSVRVALPFDLDLTEAQAELLDATLHNLFELALAPFFARVMA